jgi:hypothetical protein
MLQKLPEARAVEPNKTSSTIRQSALLLLLFLTLFATPHLYAGGPLNSINGRAVVYQNNDFPIPYQTDRGDLGSFGNGLATALVDTSFNLWSSVPTATITFQNGGQLPLDITRINYMLYLDNFTDGINPIIFDSNGAIIDAEFGAGASNGIIGFAGSSYNLATGYYVEGLAVLNGKFSAVFDDQQFQATFFHELGHFVGLDHTQINGSYVQDGNTVNDSYVPTMYPTATDDDTPLGEPNPDDEAALTLLYPASNVNTVYGMIRGSVKREDGQPVLGANVVAVKVGDEDFSQFSSVSDYYLQNNGEYEMYVTPGEYTVFIEPIDVSFTGGSSVGPYAGDVSQPAFTNPVVKEYYNGDGESSQETDLDEAVVITVAAGQTVAPIDFIAEGNVTTTTSTTITSGVNLVPYTPAGWDAPLVPSSLMGTSVVSTLCGGRATYIDFAVLNEGFEDITETFFIDIYLDGVNVAYVERDGLQSGYFVYVDDWLADPVIRAGQHTLQIIVDSENAVQEFNENDNEYTQTFTWNICLLWTPALYGSIVGKHTMEHVTRLRQVRDDVLRVHQTGNFYVDLLYDYSEEVASLLLRDPELRARTADLLAHVQPDVNALLAGEHITVSGVLLENMDALLNAFEAQASPGLQTVLKQVKKEMREGALFHELGITVQ